MKKTTLETLLRDRLTDSRAMIGSLDINHDRLLLHFGAIGELARVTLSISDNEISIVLPGATSSAVSPMSRPPTVCAPIASERVPIPVPWSAGGNACITSVACIAQCKRERERERDLHRSEQPAKAIGKEKP